MEIVALLRWITEAWQKRRADVRSATQARRRARPQLVFVTASTNPNEFTLRNKEAPITKLHVVVADTTATVRPSEYLGRGEECFLRFGTTLTFPVTVRVEYVDELGHPDAMSIRLHGGSIDVLGYDSDKR